MRIVRSRILDQYAATYMPQILLTALYLSCSNDGGQRNGIDEIPRLRSARYVFFT